MTGKINSTQWNNYINSLQKASGVSQTRKPDSPVGKSFSQVLQEQMDELKFSRHALERMETRGITMDENTYNKIMEGVSKGKAKGSKEAFMLIGNEGFLVSVDNYVVITAYGKNDLKDNIITNIDSVYIV